MDLMKMIKSNWFKKSDFDKTTTIAEVDYTGIVIEISQGLFGYCKLFSSSKVTGATASGYASTGQDGQYLK